MKLEENELQDKKDKENATLTYKWPWVTTLYKIYII